MLRKFSLMLFLMFFLCSCKAQNDTSTEQEPMAEIIIDDEKYPLIPLSQKEATEDNRMLFEQLYLSDNIPTAKIGNKIELIIPQESTNQLKLLEHLVSDDGALLFKNSLEKEIEIDTTNEATTFTLTQNINIHYSSQRPPSKFRGYILEIPTENKTEYYIFLLKVG